MLQTNTGIVRPLHESHALIVRDLIAQASPNSKYASYYPAMLADFGSNASIITADYNGNIRGAFLSLYDWNFKKLIISHVVNVFSEMAEIERGNMLHHSFESAAAKGVEHVTAHLDLAEDRALAQSIENQAAAHKMTANIVFEGDRKIAPQNIVVPDKNEVIANKDKIIFRHPTIEDALAVWMLVHHFYEVKAADSTKSGLDEYAVSNYERLFRDTPETNMVAEYEGVIGGFATGFVIDGPQNTKGLFMWQTGSIMPGAGIGSERALLDNLKPDYLNFTVEGDNGAANGTAIKKAEHLKMSWDKPRAIETEILGDAHKPEVIYTVAPQDLIPEINHGLKL